MLHKYKIINKGMNIWEDDSIYKMNNIKEMDQVVKILTRASNW